MTKQRTSILPSQPALAAFCRRYQIRRLAFFGSVLRDDFGPESDVDVLVVFEDGHTPDFFTLFELESELSDLFGGRRVDVVTDAALNPHLRERVLTTAEVHYERG
jgi:uncharacterized protein